MPPFGHFLLGLLMLANVRLRRGQGSYRLRIGFRLRIMLQGASGLVEGSYHPRDTAKAARFGKFGKRQG